MDYTHNNAVSSVNGYYVGAKGSETQVITSAGNVLAPLETVAGTTAGVGLGATLRNYGISMISSTSGAKYYVLPAPAAGITKKLICTAGSTTNTVTVYGSSGVTFDGTNVQATFNAEGDALDLVGISATRWLIMTNLGSVALATT